MRIEKAFVFSVRTRWIYPKGRTGTAKYTDEEADGE